MHLGILGVKGDAGKASPTKLDGSTGHWALGKVTSVVQWFDHDSSSGGLETNLDVSGAFPWLCHIKWHLQLKQQRNMCGFLFSELTTLDLRPPRLGIGKVSAKFPWDVTRRAVRWLVRSWVAPELLVIRSHFDLLWTVTGLPCFCSNLSHWQWSVLQRQESGQWSGLWLWWIIYVCLQVFWRPNRHSWKPVAMVPMELFLPSTPQQCTSRCSYWGPKTCRQQSWLPRSLRFRWVIGDVCSFQQLQLENWYDSELWESCHFNENLSIFLQQDLCERNETVSSMLFFRTNRPSDLYGAHLSDTFSLTTPNIWAAMYKWFDSNLSVQQ